MYAGQARHPVMIALAETVAEFAIPIEPFDALISAFEQDQAVTEYATYAQLLDYCTRSANPVGHLVLYLGAVVRRCQRPALRRDVHRPATRELLAGRGARPRDRPDLPAARGSRAVRRQPEMICVRCGSRRHSRPCSRLRSSVRAPCSKRAGHWSRGCLAPWRWTSTSSRAGAWRSSTGSWARGIDVLTRRPRLSKSDQARFDCPCTVGASVAASRAARSLLTAGGRRMEGTWSSRAVATNSDPGARRQLSLLRVRWRGARRGTFTTASCSCRLTSAGRCRALRLHAPDRRPGRRSRAGPRWRCRRSCSGGATSTARSTAAKTAPGRDSPRWPRRSSGMRSPGATSTR